MTNDHRPSLSECLAREYTFVVFAQPGGGYVIVFPDLPECMTQVESIDETAAAANEVRELWIETAYADGREVPPPSYREEYSGRFNVRLARSLHRRLVESAEQEGVSLNQYVMTLLDRNDALARVERRLAAVEQRPAGAPAVGQSRDRAEERERSLTMTATSTHVPQGFHTLTPYLSVRDAARAIAFYEQAFGATEVYRLPWSGGRIGHAELRIGDSHIMLADEMPDEGFRGPQTLGGSPVTIQLWVEDADATVNRAVAAGATLLRPVADQFYGAREGRVVDPFGYHWFVATHMRDVPIEELQRLNAEYLESQEPAPGY